MRYLSFQKVRVTVVKITQLAACKCRTWNKNDKIVLCQGGGPSRPCSGRQDMSILVDKSTKGTLTPRALAYYNPAGLQCHTRGTLSIVSCKAYPLSYEKQSPAICCQEHTKHPIYSRSTYCWMNRKTEVTKACQEPKPLAQQHCS